MIDGVEVYRIDTGRDVICDGCGKDWTDSLVSGGIYGLGTKAYCPECAPGMLKLAEEAGELEYIRARCPDAMSFANWVRDVLRHGR